MPKTLPKAVRETRLKVLAKIACEDFASMSQHAYSNWINALPAREFVALIDLHAEALHQMPQEPEQEYASNYIADEPAVGDWIDCAGADRPVVDDLVVWVKFNDGSISGPDRAGDYFWDGEFIVAYAVAKNAKPRPDEDA